MRIAWTTLVIGCLCILSCTKQAQINRPPNFIIIMADDLGYNDLSCYGNQDIETPRIDQMAKQGVRFVDFHSNGTVCSPTRAALLTGRYQQRTGVTGVITAKHHRDKGLPLSERTFAEILKENGYVTGISGKWHLGYQEKFNPIHQGFDVFSGFVSGNIDYYSHVDQEGYQDWWQQDKLTDEAGYSTKVITNKALDFITQNKDKPFALYISHEAPHYPYQGLTSKPDRAPGDKIGVDFNPLGSEKEIVPIYKEMIEIMDAEIGKTLDLLTQLKLDANTIVIFCSDNGFAPKVKSNTVLRGNKATVWEGGHRVPAIIRWPGHIQPNTISKEIVLSMDFFPTLLEIAGIENPQNIDGISIASHLFSQEPLPERTVFWQHKNSSAVRKGRWKLLVQDAKTPPELYDLENDLSEENDAADAHPQIVKTLNNELRAWQEDVSGK